jgi:hypothetical protein
MPGIDALAERAAASGGTRPSEAEHEARQTFAEAQATLLAGVRELQDLGVWVKDVDRGLLDFPSERDGEVVELCWLHGEPSVEHWHRVGEGFAGRKPL